MATSLSLDEVRGQLEPQDQEQELAFETWKQLPTDWLGEDDFLERLAKVSGMEEGWKGHDLSAWFMSLHSAGYVEVRRTGRLDREVRRSPERPRFYSFVERAEADQQSLVIFQREQKDKELARQEEARLELQRPAIEVEREELAEAIDDHPRVRELRETVADLEAELRSVKVRLALQEKLGGTGTTA
jgi:hypothetical protein